MSKNSEPSSILPWLFSLFSAPFASLEGGTQTSLSRRISPSGFAFRMILEYCYGSLKRQIYVSTYSFDWEVMPVA